MQQGVGLNLTVQAQTSGGAIVSGYRGTVSLASSWGSVPLYAWGGDIDPLHGTYTFTATDAGVHVFPPSFRYAGDQTATFTDTALASRTVTTSALTVTNSPAGAYAHGATPAGLKLPDGTLVWATTGVRGRLYVRRNVGSASQPIWTPPLIVRDAQDDIVGADTPSLARLGSTLALFHTYTDGTYFQIWVVTSADDGRSWSAPTQITHETGHVQRIQSVVSGGTLYLFWSRQDTNGKLFYETTTDLSAWSTKATVGQSIGVPVASLTSNFGIARTAGGSWTLGWIAPSAVGQFPYTGPGDPNFPTVHIATSTDLSTWSTATELYTAYSQRWPLSVGLAQDPGTGLIWALYEQNHDPYDLYLVARTSSDGVNWAAQKTVGYDHSQPVDGRQGYGASMPAAVPGSMSCAWSASANGGGSVPPYSNHASWENKDSGGGPTGGDCDTTPDPPAPPATPPTPDPPTPPPGGDPTGPQGPTGGCGNGGDPIDGVTGYASTGATDLVVAARGLPLAVNRSYNSYDGVAFVTGPFGYGWSWCYGVHAITGTDGSVTIVEGSGARLHFWKNGSGWTPDVGVYDTLAAASGGGYTLTRHNQVVWRFNAAGQLSSITDRNGNTQTLTYSGANLTTVTAPGGRALTITTDGNGHITGVSGAGLSAAYTYDAGGNLATATDAAGSTTTYTYDVRHELLTIVDANNHTVETNTYGSLGRVARQLDALNQATTFSYAYQGYAGSYGGASQITDPRGIQTNLYNDAYSRITRRDIVYNTVLQQQIFFSYDAQGNVLSMTDPAGRITAYTYDARGNVLTATADQGGLNLTTTYTYNGTNDLLTVTDPLGHTAACSYDSRGNLLTTTADSGGLNLTTTYTYDATTGQLISATDATSRTVSYGYNSAGDLTTVTAAGPVTATLGYDAAGRLTSVTDPLNHTTTSTLDGLGRLKTVTNALGQTTTLTYDSVGNRKTVTDALTPPRTTTWAYDALDRVTSVTDPLTQQTTYAYDADSNLTTLTNARGKAWTYTYDGLNRVATAKDPLANTATYSYDTAGNLSQLQKPDGVVNAYQYDHLNRLTGVDFTNHGGTPDIQYSYDNAGRRTSMIDGTGTTTYSYDAANRLLSAAAPTTGTLSYGYDSAGRETSVAYPSGHQVSYAYTARGQLQTVTDWLSHTTTYSYDTADRLTGISFPNGVSTTLGYDTANRLTSLVHSNGSTTLLGITYQLNAVGVRTQMVDNAGTTTWGYDALDRLTSATYPNGDAVSYGYDPAGNRTTLTVNGT